MKRKVKKNKNLLKEKYVDSFNLIKKCKNYIFIAFLILFFMSIVGFVFPGLFEEEVLKIIKEILAQLEGKSAFELVIYIFVNNFKASFFIMVLGVLFGVFPIIGGLVNGYVIGFTANLAIEREGVLILWRLLPHGIFELPAIILSMGVGIYLGSRFLEKSFKIKSYNKKLIIVSLISLVATPIGFVYLKLSERVLLLKDIPINVLSNGQLLLFLGVGVLNIVLIIGILLIFYCYFRNKELRRDFCDALWFFILIIFPLLLIAGIIEGILVGFLNG